VPLHEAGEGSFVPTRREPMQQLGVRQFPSAGHSGDAADVVQHVIERFPRHGPSFLRQCPPLHHARKHERAYTFFGHGRSAAVPAPLAVTELPAFTDHSNRRTVLRPGEWEGLSMRRAPWLILVASGLAAWTPGAGRLAADDKKDDKGTVVEIGALKSRTPADWKEQEVSDTARSAGRLLYFHVPHAKGDERDAEMFVFHFREGGGAEADNIKRWKGMFIPPAGKTIDDVTKVKHTKVGDSKVTVVDIHGTYKYKRAPFVPDERAEKRPDQRLIAVIFDTKDGPYYFRFVGPAKTVEQHKKGFDRWVAGFK
jgi:hypothetical protein